MMRVGLREANQNFSRLVRAVRQGTEVVLTERGRPIARLTPIKTEPATHKESAEELLRRLAAEGLVRRATRSGPLRRFKPVKISGPPISQTIQDEREER
jgi:prevent-host-death family protein